MIREKLTREGVLAALGPGLVWAAAAIGVSHLVQSTRAGAVYGWALVGVVIAANVLKYPFFEYGPRYAAATGESLVDGYRRQGTWAVWIYFLLTLGTMFAVAAAVTFVAGSLATQLFGPWLSPLGYSAILLGLCALLLVVGRYPLLDKLVKVIMVVLALSTIAAVVAAALGRDGVPAEGAGFDELTTLAGFSFLIALVGWMPSAVDISVWHSLWTLERAKETHHRPRLREALFDFNLGYWGTACLALLFLSLGALVFYGRGQEVAGTGIGFSFQLIELYTSALGRWARPVIVLAAFTTMFSTVLTVTDAFPRALRRTTEILFRRETPGPPNGEPTRHRSAEASRRAHGEEVPAGEGGGEEGDAVERRVEWLYWGWMVVLIAGALPLIGAFRASLTGMVDLATTLSFLTSPVLGYLNYRAVTSAHMPEGTEPPAWLRVLTWIGLVFGVVFGIAFLGWRFVWA